VREEEAGGGLDWAALEEEREQSPFLQQQFAESSPPLDSQPCLG